MDNKKIILNDKTYTMQKLNSLTALKLIPYLDNVFNNLEEIAMISLNKNNCFLDDKNNLVDVDKTMTVEAVVEAVAHVIDINFKNFFLQLESLKKKMETLLNPIQ